MKLFPTKRTQAMARRARPAVESLEERALLTVGVTLDPSGLLLLQGDGGDNVATVSINKVNPADPNTWQVRVNADGAQQTFPLMRPTSSGWEYNVARLCFYGYDGHDTFSNSTMLSSVAYGGEGSDQLRGGSAQDIIYGEGGPDTLNGDINNEGDGGDRLYGGADWDTLFAFQGGNVLDGGTGNDTLRIQSLPGAVSSANSLLGGSGNDDLLGGGGADNLYGGDGYDRLYGEGGNDCLDGGCDIWMDLLSGGEGMDTFVFYTGTQSEHNADFDPYLDILAQRDPPNEGGGGKWAG